jgi:hypothetical protein
MASKTETEKKPDSRKDASVDGRPIGLSLRDLQVLIGKAFGPGRFGLPVLLLAALLLLVVSGYLSWWLAIPRLTAWANQAPWRWIIGWFPVLFAAFIPIYVAIGAWAIIAPALQAAGERKEKEALGELDRLENKIRGSVEPVDYAVYGRKALNAYYLMGQNQARLSFYVGVAAMIFGFVFLLAGLFVQIIDVGQVPYLRKDSNVEVVTVGGGLIIEFIAATFLWIYRAAIVQLTVYYKRQMLVHSALIAVAVSAKMTDQSQVALLRIIDTMITPYWEDSTSMLRGPRASKARQTSTLHDKPESA